MKSREYFLFGGGYEAAGGWGDYLCHCYSVSTAMESVVNFMAQEECQWIEIVDIEMKEVVFRAVCLYDNSWMIAPSETISWSDQ